jgi:hydroxypyruvate reductase
MLLTGYYNVRKENLMNKELRAVADNIIDAAIKAVLPDEAVKKINVEIMMIKNNQ